MIDNAMILVILILSNALSALIGYMIGKNSEREVP